MRSMARWRLAGSTSYEKRARYTAVLPIGCSATPSWATILDDDVGEPSVQLTAAARTDKDHGRRWSKRQGRPVEPLQQVANLHRQQACRVAGHGPTAPRSAAPFARVWPRTRSGVPTPPPGPLGAPSPIPAPVEAGRGQLGGWTPRLRPLPP